MPRISDEVPRDIRVQVSVSYTVEHSDEDVEALGGEVIRAAIGEFMAGLHARFEYEGLAVARLEMTQEPGKG